MHSTVVLAVGAVVLTGSTGHSAQLNPLANQTGYGAVLDAAASADVAAKVANQTNLLITQEADDSAKSLNAQVALPTSDDAVLDTREVVNTTGAAVQGIQNYKVKAGDTLSSVAQQYNITSDTIRWANGLAADATLNPGDNLVILPISGVRYTVVAGDSAQSIADKFQSNPDQIVAFNNAEVAGLQPGQTIVVPDGVVQEAKKSSATPVPAASARSTAAAIPFFGNGNSYARGYCTWYVASRRSIPDWWGNARSWYSNAQISGFRVGSAPAVGAIAWTGAGYYGHVAYVEGVSGNQVTVSEMNWNGNWNRVTRRTVPASSFRYIY